MIPCCCICGTASKRWHDPEWEDAGGLQDFCPDHANTIRIKHGDLTEFIVPHMRSREETNFPLTHYAEGVELRAHERAFLL